MSRFFATPQQLDIVYGRFPYSATPGSPASEPHYCLVLDVLVNEATNEPWVIVAMGTSKNTGKLYTGEFLVQPDDTNGLAKSTKFSLRRDKIAKLPYCEEWFDVPPSRRSTPAATPNIGKLTPTRHMRALKAAALAVNAGSTCRELELIELGLLARN